MPRLIAISVPSKETDRILRELRLLDGVVGLRVQQGISLEPPGDLIEVEILNRRFAELMRLLDAKNIGRADGTSLSSSLPASLVSPKWNPEISGDTSESSWEEMELTLGRESNMSLNNLLVMLTAGFLSTAGIGTGALHLVIAAMVIAPGFEPLTRISLGLVTAGRGWKQGLSASIRGYLSLIGGGAAGAFLLEAADKTLFEGHGSYMTRESLVSYWTTLQMTSLSVSALAAAAGAVLIAAHRSVLTAGVMIALALVPSASLVGGALVAGNTGVAFNAFIRWIVEVGIVIAASSLVFLWKRLRTHKRRSGS